MWSRGRERRRLASVQEIVPLEGIAGDIVCLRGGAYRAVLEASGVNFRLKPEGEQEAILASFRRLLNGLDHPLQVLVRVVPADVEGYLAGLGEGGAGTEALGRLRRDHEAFVRRIARERTLLDRRFHVVVPAGVDGTTGRGGPAWRDLFRPGRASAATDRGDGLPRARRTLAVRCAEVERGLGAFGVGARRLHGEELAALWRATVGGSEAGAGSQGHPAASPAASVAATPVATRVAVEVGAVHPGRGRAAAGA